MLFIHDLGNNCVSLSEQGADCVIRKTVGMFGAKRDGSLLGGGYIRD